MVAFVPSLSDLRIMQGTASNLPARFARGAGFSLKAHTRSISFGNSTLSNLSEKLPPGSAVGSHPSKMHVIAIVSLAVGGAIALTLVLALVYVWQIRRKVERFRKSMNVLGPELTPIPRPPDVASMDQISVSQLTPSTSKAIRLPSVSTQEYKRHSCLSGSSLVISPMERRRERLQSRARCLTIDIDMTRTMQQTLPLLAVGSQTPMRAPHEAVPSPVPTPLPRSLSVYTANPTSLRCPASATECR